MRVSVFGTLPNMILTKEFKRMKFSKINLEKNASQVSITNNKIVRERIGTLEHDTVLRVPCFYVNIDFPAQEEDANEALQIFRGVLQGILFSMWLVKDHSVHSDLIFSISDFGISTNRSPVTHTNSAGDYTENHFTKEEISEAETWFSIEREVSHKKIETEVERIPVTLGSITTYIPKNLPYVNTNRLDRATRFVLEARSESFLPAKITFYISALESLLSTSNNEVKMQVADRSSRVLGATLEDRIRLNKTVDIAYSFRSNYIHGSVSSEKSIKNSLKKRPISFSSVEELSLELDNVVRNIIKRFLTDLNYVVQLDNTAFAEWIDELLYK